MFGRKRRAEPTPLLAKRFEMPPALSTTNLHCSPWQLREKGTRSGVRRRAAAVTWQREEPDGRTAGRTNKPSFPSRCPGGGDGRARGGGRLGCLPGDPHPGGGRRRAGAPGELGLIAPTGHCPGPRRGELLGYPEERIWGMSRAGGGSPRTRGRRGPLEPPPGWSPEPRKWLGVKRAGGKAGLVMGP